jgi:hypothetical protein
MKIYKVVITASALRKTETADHEIRAVRAKTRAQAVAYAARLHITAEVATQEDSFKFGEMGIAIEDATETAP